MADPDVAWVCGSCGTFNDGQSASCAVCLQARAADPGATCVACGAVSASGADRFCRTCGAPFGAAGVPGDVHQYPTAHTVVPHPIPGPAPVPSVSAGSTGYPMSQPMPGVLPVGASSGGTSLWLWVALVGVIVVLVAVAGVMLLGRSASSKFSYAGESTPGGVRRSPTTSATSSTTGVASRAPSTSSLVPTPDDGASFVTELDGILQGSKATRSNLGLLLDDVRSCALQPWEAQGPIQELAAERGRTLDQVNALDTGGSAEASQAKSYLVSALTASRESDTHYASVVGRMTGCGTLPTADVDFIAARDSSDPAASSAKRSFVAVYNPLAARFGAKSDWIESEI